MTPREKAIELVCKMYGCHKFDLDYVSIHFSDQYQIAKDNALIAVDEIIEMYSKLFKDFDKVSLFITVFKTANDFDETMNDLKNNQLKPYAIKSMFYWEQIRKEIEAL